MTKHHSRSATGWLLDPRILMGLVGAVSGFVVGGITLDFGIGIIFGIAGFGVGYAFGCVGSFIQRDDPSHDERGGGSNRS